MISGFFVFAAALTQTRSTKVPTTRRFESLFIAEAPYVMRLLRRFGVPPRDIEDTAQEVFVRVHKRFDDYDPSRPARPWLYAFAFRCASNYRQLHRNKNELLIPEAAEPSHADTPESAQAQTEQRALLAKLLEDIPWKQRAVLVMHDLEGLSAQDIATVLETPVTTIYSRLQTGRTRLAALASREESI